MPSRSRRDVLGLLSAGFSIALGGCVTDGTATQNRPSPSTSSPSIQNGSATPAPACPTGYSSLTPTWIVEGSGPLAGFTLTLDHEEITPGDTLTCKLRNVTNEEKVTGIKRKCDLQYRAQTGWHTILGTPKGHGGWSDLGMAHAPGDGFTWRFPFTRDGIVSATGYAVCVPLTPGTYRFVYWGITTEREARTNYETNYALGIPFTVVQN